jgi:hypothetical protein
MKLIERVTLTSVATLFCSVLSKRTLVRKNDDTLHDEIAMACAPILTF